MAKVHLPAHDDRVTPAREPRIGRASRHYAIARRRGWDATNCDGFVRTLYVRPGGGRFWTRIGFICDGCAGTALDPDWQDAIALSAERARAARLDAEASGTRRTSKERETSSRSKRQRRT
jgi:hypothetical protein